MRRLVLLALVLVALTGLAVHAQTHTFTVSWTQDTAGGQPDGYAITVDGSRAVVTATCTGTGPLTCTAPLTMTLNVAHTVTVSAFNVFGEATSSPFSAAPPGRPAAVVIR